MKNKQHDEYWPHWAYKSKRDWKRDVRKRWVQYRNAINIVRFGCSYYPVKLNLDQFKENDEIMKKWFKKA